MKFSFHRFAHVVSTWSGHPLAFVLSTLLIVVWACFGPMFDYSDTWQLMVNTTTTIVTFLMVFLIQNTQNRDTREIHLKLDELIRSHSTARNSLINLEGLSDHELDLLHRDLCNLKETTDERLEKIQKTKKKRSER